VVAIILINIMFNLFEQLYRVTIFLDLQEDSYKIFNP